MTKVGSPPPRFGDARLGRHVPALALDDPPPPPVPLPEPPKKKVSASIPAATRKDIPRPTNHALGPTGEIIEAYCLHYNGGTLRRACRAYADLIGRGGQMFLAMAGACSTAELGKVIAPLIRRGFISGLSVTGANLEEDFFRLLGHQHYVEIPEYQDLTKADDVKLADAEMPRVTDSTIPEKAAMAKLEGPVDKLWKQAAKDHRRIFPHEPLYDLLNTGALLDGYEKDPAESWLYAAAQHHLPIVVPGWGDSTLGQVFTAGVYTGEYDPTIIKGDAEYNAEILMPWYVKTAKDQQIPIGFFQLGGGIAGDYSICAVPCLKADAKVEVPFWSYFCQITDAQESCGGYSGAMPQEKITWLKVEPSTPAFAIFGDYTTIFPFLAAYLLGW